MVTSIADLLDELDRESKRPDLGAEVAARGLHEIGRLLRHLRTGEPGGGLDDMRVESAETLATACRQAGSSFPGARGRLSDLAGVLADAVGRAWPDLTDVDRWAVATSVAFVVKRCSTAIEGSGRHDRNPLMNAVRYGARCVIRAAVDEPPTLNAGTELRAPIPGAEPVTGPPGRVVVESTAALVGYFQNHSREPMTISQLTAVSHVAERLFTVLSETPFDSADQAAYAWRTARRALACVADVPDRRRPRCSPVLDWSRQLDDALTAARTSDLPCIRLAASHTPRFAREIEGELRRVERRLVLGRGPQPLSEDRVADWLNHRATTVTPPDLVLLHRAVARAAGASRVFTEGMGYAPSPIEMERVGIVPSLLA